MAVYEALLLNTVVPQIQAAQAGDSYVMVVNATTPALRITQTGTGNALEVEDSANPDATPFVVSAAGDVGIGTSSNRLSNKLDVRGNIAFGSNANYYGQIGYDAGVGTIDLTSSDGAFRFIRQSGPVTSMLLDTSGNLGLGVTPSAWLNTRAFNIGGFGAVSCDTATTGVLSLSYNAYAEGASTWKYKVDGVSGLYQQTDAHKWFNAASGTAGNAISFTQALTLDATGNLLVNQTTVGNGGTLSVNGTLSIGTTTNGLQLSMSKIGTKQTSSISTSATTIFTDVTQGMSSASAGQFLIFGDDNSGNGFMDVVVARSSGTVAVVSSSTVRGSPTARTYTMSTGALQLAMASGTYSTMVRCETLGYPY
jgi:hypothetical protein